MKKPQTIQSCAEASSAVIHPVQPMSKGFLRSGMFLRQSLALALIPVGLMGQAASNPSPTAAEVVVLPAFQVSNENDDGYFAKNTLAGTRTNERVINIPQNISIVTRKLLEDLNQDNGVNALAYVVSGINKRSELNSDTFIRGFRVTAFLKDNITGGGGGALIIPLYDIDRIEVIKGPAALLFGRSASTGGLYNYISKKPSSQREISLKATVGSYNSYRFEASATGELAKGTNIRATVAATDSEGPQDFTYFKDKFFSFSMDHELSSKNTVNVYYSYYRVEKILPVTLTDTTAVLIAASDNFSFYEPWVQALTYSHNAGLTFTSVISPTLELQAKVTYVADTLDWVTVNAGGSANSATGIIPRNVNVSLYGPGNQSVTGIVDLFKKFTTGPIDHKVTFGALLIGAQNQFQGHNFTLASINYKAPVHTTPAPVYTLGVKSADTIGTPTNRIDRNREDSFYIQEQASMFKGRLIAVAGWRYNQYLTDSTNLVSKVVTSFNPSAPVKRYGVVFKPLDSLSVYYNYSESFVFNNGVLVGGPRNGLPLEASFGENNEVGLKVETRDGRYFGSVAAFDLTLTNVRTLYVQPDGIAGIAQTGSHINKGYELDIGTSWETPVGPFQAIVTWYSGDIKNELKQKPAQTVNNMWSFFFSQAINNGALKNLSFGGGAYYKGSAPFANNPGQLVPYIAPGYTTGTAFITYQWKNTKFVLNIDNITDKRYVNGGQSSAWLDVVQGRTFKFSAAYRF